VCCSIDDYEDDANGCVASCECSYSEEREGTRDVVDAEYPVRIRGVPILTQFDAKTRRGNQPIGCGPIAVSQLALYYGAWGWTDLIDTYKGSSGQAKWKDLAYDAADALDTWVRNNASPTFMRKMKPGIEDLFSDLGYSTNVTYETVKSKGTQEADSFEHIKSSILQGRPVILGFDVNEEAGNGIGGGGDNVGFIDHYGLIVGYDDTGSTPRIEINMGFGYIILGEFDGGQSINEGASSYEWEIGSGKVHLWFVEMDASEKTTLSNGKVDEECALPSPKDIYSPDFITDEDGVEWDVGATYALDSTPVMRELMQGSDCDLLGGEVTHEEDYTYTAYWSDEFSCHFRYGIFDEMLAGEWDPETPEEPGIIDRIDP